MATVSNAILRAHYQQAERSGYVREDRLLDAGLNLQAVRDGHGRSSADAFARWLSSLWRENDDESGGFLPQPVKSGTFAMSMHAIITAGNLRRALLRSSQFYRLVNPHLVVDLQEQGEEAHLVFRLGPDDQPAHPVFYDALIVLWLRWSSWIIDQPLLLERVNVAFDTPEYGDEYPYMYQCPVYVNQPDCRVILAKRYLDQPLARSPADLADFLSLAPGNLLVQFQPQDSVSASVLSLFSEHGEALTDQQWVAEHLAVSGATLRRQLKREGTSFQQLKDQWRRKEAYRLLKHSTLTLPEISTQLGYSELSAFSRAFKAWTGRSPRSIRDHRSESADSGTREPR